MDITDNGAPAPDYAEDSDPLNPDTYEDGDTDGASMVQN